MNTPQDGIKKAAILVSALDRASADAVLEQMEPDQAARVRRTMVELDAIDPDLQRRIIEEFLRVGPMVPPEQPSGIELDDRLDSRLAARLARGTARDETPAVGTSPFRFLRRTECEHLARLLSTERPQTIALVLAHLPPQQAGNVLVLLPEATGVEVVRRLIDLEETDPEILREVEQGLQERLSRQLPMQRARVAGLSAVAEILKASAPTVGARILDNLGRHDRHLAEQFAPPRLEFAPPQLEFDDLARLDSAGLATLVDATDRELLVLALTGAPPAMIHRFLDKMPATEAEAIRHELDHPGPMRLSDVEEARRRIAELACRLAAAGRIELPKQSHYALEGVAV
jgi:flagellar motor switch protein FliG